MDIGVAGLGIMGLSAATKLLEHGFTVWGYDVFPRAAERAEKAGVRMAASLEEMAEILDIALLFVPGPKETEAVIVGDKGLIHHARQGLVIVNMSTVDPDVNIRMSQVLADRGVGIIDAPGYILLKRAAPELTGQWSLAPYPGTRQEDGSVSRWFIANGRGE